MPSKTQAYVYELSVSLNGFSNVVRVVATSMPEAIMIAGEAKVEGRVTKAMALHEVILRSDVAAVMEERDGDDVALAGFATAERRIK